MYSYHVHSIVRYSVFLKSGSSPTESLTNQLLTTVNPGVTRLWYSLINTRLSCCLNLVFYILLLSTGSVLIYSTLQSLAGMCQVLCMWRNWNPNMDALMDYNIIWTTNYHNLANAHSHELLGALCCTISFTSSFSSKHNICHSNLFMSNN